jgi:hypothetical protein
MRVWIRAARSSWAFETARAARTETGAAAEESSFLSILQGSKVGLWSLEKLFTLLIKTSTTRTVSELCL